MTSTDPDVVKACCAAGYQSDLVALILGDSYHPGGPALTRRLADALGVTAGQRVLDVASGPGSTALLLAQEYGATVEGVDLGSDAVEAANRRAQEAATPQVSFRVGDAERLPVADASVDVVISECALCTFPDKVTALGEMARVLRPGGRVGITDVTMDPGRLDPELTDLAGWIACLADARPLDGYRELMTAAGLSVTVTEPHDAALARMIDLIDARITVLAMAGTPALADIDLKAVRRRVRAAKAAVADGVAGYVLVVAVKA
ncbi:MAG: methyltransferase domain-containing protein [Actinomycetota bacterium]|nr:methyltransferase domain-containing protein [Actinomycetota bacterium]